MFNRVELSKFLSSPSLGDMNQLPSPSSEDAFGHTLEDASSLLLPLTLLVEKLLLGRVESLSLPKPSSRGSTHRHPDGEGQDSLVQLALLSLAAVFESHEGMSPSIERQVSI